MSRSTGKTYDRYLARGLSGDVLTEAEIMRGLRGVVHAYERTREVDPHTKSQMISKLLNAYADNPRAITPEHTAKGLRWFAKMHKGNELIGPTPAPWRDTELTRCFSRYARGIVDNFERFEFVGLEDVSRGGWPHYVPEYRVIARNGESFTYHCESWQSGGGVSVY